MPLKQQVLSGVEHLLLKARWRVWQLLANHSGSLAAVDDLLAWHGCQAAASQKREAGNLGRVAAAGAILHLQATRAHLLGELGRWADARSQLVLLRGAQPDNPLHTYNLGFVCQQMGDTGAAAEAFRSCIDIAPQHDQAWYGLGLALQSLGDAQGAELAWRQQVRLQPLCPDGYMGLVRLSVDRLDAEAAKHWLRQLRGFAPRQALALEPLLLALAGSDRQAQGQGAGRGVST